MKKVIFLLIIAFFLAGCTAEWYKHDTIYKTNDHMTFSWWGYNNPSNEDLHNLNQKDGGARKFPISRPSSSLVLESCGYESAELMTSFRLYL